MSSIGASRHSYKSQTHAFHSSMYHYALPKHHAISVMYHLTVRPLIANTVGALLTSSSTVLAAAVRGTALAPLMNSTCAYTMPRSTCHADIIRKSCVTLCSITENVMVLTQPHVYTGRCKSLKMQISHSESAGALFLPGM